MGRKLSAEDFDPLISAWTDLEEAVQHLGELIAHGVSESSDASNALPKQSDESGGDVNYLALARMHYKMRQAIEGHSAFKGVFGDPAFNILLDLFLSHLIDKCVSITDTALAGNVPTTTAIRWLAVLESRGYIQRRRDETDLRRSFVSLTPNGFSQVRDLLTQVHSKLIL